MSRIRSRSPRSGGRARRRQLALGALVAALFASPIGAEEERQSEIDSWYAQTVARSPSGFNINYFWSLGAKFRAETVASGHKIITIVNGDTYYAYDAVTMKGVAIRRTREAIAADGSKPRPFGNEVDVLLSQGAEKIRDEELYGVQSEVYQITDDLGRRVVWFTKDDRRLPMRVELYDRRTGATSYREYTGWQSGLPIVEAFFRPEATAQLRRFEFEEYVGSVDDREVMGLAPILYEELLVGPPAAGDEARAGVSSPR